LTLLARLLFNSFNMYRGDRPIFKLRGMQSRKLENGKGAWVPTQLVDAFWRPDFSVTDFETYQVPAGCDVFPPPSVRLNIELGALSVFGGYEAAG